MSGRVAAALAALEAGRREDALAALDAAAADPRDVDAAQLRARLALQDGDADRAARLLERAVQLAPRRTALRNDLGVALRFLGQDAAAARVFEAALLTAPADCDALHNLGMTRRRLGDRAGAAQALERAARFGARAASWAALGMVRDEAGDAAGALAAFGQAAALEPEAPQHRRNLALALFRAGRDADAVAAFEACAAAFPDDAALLSDHGVALARLGRVADAERVLRAALRLDPERLAALRALANLVAREEAEQILRRALALAPRDPELWIDYAAHNRRAGAFDRAAQSLDRADALAPDDPAAHHERGLLRLDQGDAPGAEALFRAGLARRPDHAPTLASLARALWEQRLTDAALAAVERALALDPRLVEALVLRGALAIVLGDLDDAAARFRAALAVDAAQPVTDSNLLFIAQYRDDWEPAANRAAHEAWAARHCPPAAAPAIREPRRVLRLGLLSPDFNRHPVGFFTLPLFRHLDRAQVVPVCLATGRAADDLTQAIRATGPEWIDCAGIEDDALEAGIRAARIDALVDLSGHTSGHRLPVFGRRPAPMQLTWAGYVGTTGIAAMDFLVADRFHVPEELESDHTERILRLPDGYVCYAPPAYAPAVAPLPMLARGAPAFAAFHNPAKIGAASVALWARVLAAVPDARLLLKYRGLDAAQSRARIAAAFAAHGIDPARLAIEGSSPHERLLARYGDADVALDSLPYSGGLTTLEALWMGVPVVTLPGRRFAGRHSLSHVSNAGFPDWAVRDADAYVAKAVALVSDPPALAHLRASMRARLAASPAFDGARFAANFAAALAAAWRQ